MKKSGFSAALFFCLVSLLFIRQTAHCQDMTIDATVDKKTVQFGESLTLVITITQSLGAGGGTGVGAPRITSIPGFDIAGQRSSQNMSFVNGVGQVTLQTAYELVPQGPGEHVIPALSIRGPDGKTHTTQPIQISVKPPSEEKEGADAKETPDDPPEDEPSRTREGFSFTRGLMVVVLVVVLVIGATMLFAWFLGKSTTRNTRWDKKAPAGPSKGTAPDYSTPKSEISDAHIVQENPKVSPEGPKAPPPPRPPIAREKIDFEIEVEALKRSFPDAGIEFYRKYFELFRSAILSRNHRLEPTMTPDELMKKVLSMLPPVHSEKVRNLGEDWECVAFANTRPGRSFSAIHSDTMDILATFTRQER